jgi:hypothetical protein
MRNRNIRLLLHSDWRRPAKELLKVGNCALSCRISLPAVYMLFSKLLLHIIRHLNWVEYCLNVKCNVFQEAFLIFCFNVWIRGTFL